ncbi:MAG TPA: ABC transporter substrate-binding protein, partial [Mycoplana sp.]|nr:ABC transporter substrate-binding protein [Mycoplana sp.]
MRLKKMIAGLAFGISVLTANAASAVDIEYWQYVFDTRVKAMDQLIQK